MNAWCPPTSEPIASRESSSGRQGFSFENHFVVAIAGEVNGKVVAADGPLVAAARVLVVPREGRWSVSLWIFSLFIVRILSRVVS